MSEEMEQILPEQEENKEVLIEESSTSRETTEQEVLENLPKNIYNE